MKHFFTTYGLYIKTFFKSRAEYRIGFFLALFSNFYCYFITYTSYWILISKFDFINGWDFQDLSILYGLSLLSYSITATLIWYTVYNLSGIIISGGLDTYLTRPEGVLKQLIWQRFGDTALAQIFVTLIFLGSALIIKIDIITPLKFLYLLSAIIGGVLIQSGGMIFVGALNFWFIDSTAAGKIAYEDIKGMINYPITIYPKWIKSVLTFVFPWLFINYYPALIILNKTTTTGDRILGLISPLVGILFFVLSLIFFNKGLKKYSGTGN